MFAFLYFGVVAAAAVGRSIEDSNNKKTVRELPNGIKYWIDREGRFRLYSNNKIIHGDCTGRWYDDKYNLICDKKAIERQRAYSEAVKNNHISYCAFTPITGGHLANIETSSGRVIAKLERLKTKDGGYICKKYYLHDIHKNSRPANFGSNWTVFPNTYDLNEYTVISESEFEGLLPTDCLCMCRFNDEKTGHSR